MSAPLVSILVPVYNRRTILRQSVESALAQTVRDIEVVIVDNASTDGTWEVCQELARQDSRVRIFQQPTNTGPIRNWQRCMAEARAYYAKCVWSDDLISPDSLEKTLPYLSDPTVGLVFNAARIFSDQGVGEVLYDHHGDRPGYLSRDEYLSLMLYKQGASVPNSPVASLFRLKDLRESVLLKVPSPIIKDYPDHSMGTDVLAHLLVAQRYERVAYVPEPMTMFRSHPDSITTWALTEASEKWTDSYQQVKIWFALAHNRPIDLQMLIAQEWWRIFTIRNQGRQAMPLIDVARRFLEQPKQAGIPDHRSDVLSDARYIRSVFATFWANLPDRHLEDIFQGEAGGFYRTSLYSDLTEQPLTNDEQALLQQFSAKVAAGLEQPGGLGALMASMLYLKPGTMRVRDAATRLPSWLLPDYQQRFEAAAPTTPAPAATPSSPAPAAAAPAQPPTVPPYESLVDLNRLLGLAHLYYIDPTEPMVIEECRKQRRSLVDWIAQMPGEQLAAIYAGEFGRRYRAFLTCGIQNEQPDAAEQALLQSLSSQIAQGFDRPQGVQALMAAMLYYQPGQMRVRDAASRLPAWLLADYQQVFESNSPIVPPQPVETPAPIAPPTSATAPLHQDMTFLNRLLGCANLYYIDPEETSIAEELRLIRQQVGQIWAQTPLEQLESLYKSEFGRRYLALLDSGYQNYPLLPEEESVVQELTGLISQGIARYPGLNALLTIMMYLPPGKMQVRDAANRLPAWLLPDYQRIFEAGQATTAPLVPSPQPTVPTAAPAAAAPPAVSQPPNLAEDMVFLNRFLGCSNLYEIDPEDGETVAELRQLRQRMAEFWLTVPPSQLEAVFNSELGRRYGMYLKSGFQREPLTDGERELLVKLAETVARGFDQPGGLNAFLGAMMYYAPGQMQVKDAATRLPGWLFPLYAAVFESEAQKKMTS